MTTLLIVESPTKEKSIRKFLGRSYVVKSSMGHVRDLPKSQLGVDVENDFEPHYISIRGKGEILRSLKEEAKKADRILLASDPDREGEAIAWHLSQCLGRPEVSERIEFHEITKQAVQNAVKHPRAIDMDRVDAQQARRVLDRLVGYQLSPLLWRKVKKGLSAGRVQSAALLLICQREAEIRAFVPQEYWELLAELAAEHGNFSARLFRVNGKKANIHDKETMDAVLAGLQGRDFLVKQVQKKEQKRNPAPPFTTSSLQQEAARKLNMSPKKTMQVAQQLYEGVDVGESGSSGLITYIRTDSVRVADVAQEMARDYSAERYGSE